MDLLYARGMRRLRLRPMIAGASVALPPGTALLPEECACCGKPASHRVAVRSRAGTSLLVGYCDECAEHQAAASSRVLSLALASLLLGLVTAAGLPLLAARAGLLGLAFAAGAAALVPLALLLLPQRLVEAPHVAHGRAVQWQLEQRIWCARESYAARVAQLNGAAAAPAALRQALGSSWCAVGPLVGVVAACLSYFVYHPLLRVINLGSARIEVAIDGAHLAAVDATSNESPSAGALLRVPAGRHVLSVSSAVDGTALASVNVDFQSGAVHLFAPGAGGICFWLETTGYGQEQLVKPSYQPLVSEDHFWVLPGGIDTWFAANPAPSDPGSRSSGGLLTALRQAPCSEAPPEAHASE
jgi:hypothetical protein